MKLREVGLGMLAGALFVILLFGLQYGYDFTNPMDESIVNITVSERYPSAFIIVTPDNQLYYAQNASVFWNMRIGNTYQSVIEVRRNGDFGGGKKKWISNLLDVYEPITRSP